MGAQRQLWPEIRSLMSTVNSPDELVGEVADEFFQACDDANKRCAIVAGLLVEGLRDEAIALAETPPRLLPLISNLDSPIRTEWLGFLAMRGFESPPELNLETASIIEEAYEQQRRLEPLMRTHRLLALSRASLAARLQVLRKLEQNDPTNPIWPADIEKFEHARIEQIRREATSARAKLDLETLARLSDELSGPWSIKIPSDLRNSVSVSSEMLARQRALNEMKPLASQLNDCLAAFDAGKALAIRDSWDRLNGIAQINGGHPLYEQAKEALLWLQEVERERAVDAEFDAAVAKLESALDGELELPIIDQRWYAVQKFQRDVPAELKQRFTEYKTRLLQAQQRRTTLRVVALAAGVVLVATLVGWYVFNQGRRALIRDARAQMKSLVESSNWDAAEQFFKSQPEFVQGDGEVLQGIESLRSAVAADQNRKSQLGEALDSIRLEGILDEKVDALIQTAESLAHHDSEKTRVALIRGKLDAERELRLKDRTSKFVAELNRFGDQLKSLEQSPPNEESRNSLSRLKSDLTEFQSRHQGKVEGRSHVAAPALAQVNSLISRIDSRVRAISDYHKSLERIAGISTAIGNPDLFGKALIEFSNDFPATPWAADFRKTASEQKLWTGLADWKAMAQDRGWPKLADLDHTEAKRLLSELDKLDQSLSIPSMRTQLAKMKGTLKQISTGRTIDQAEVIQRVLKAFDTSEYKNQAIIVEEDDDGKLHWRYLKGWYRPDANDTNINYTYYKDLFKDDKMCKSANRRRSQLPQIGLAGQCKMASEIVRTVGTRSSSSADDLLLNLLAVVTENYEPAKDLTAVDPIVQVLALKRILELSAEASPAIGDLTKLALADLKAGAYDEVDWFSGDNPQTLSKRDEAEILMAKLRTSFSELKGGVDHWRQRTSADADWSPLQMFEWVGWTRMADNSIDVQSTSNLNNGIELYVFIPTGAANGADFVIVGTYNNGFVLPHPDAARLCQSGRPVFAKQPTNTRASE